MRTLNILIDLSGSASRNVPVWVPQRAGRVLAVRWAQELAADGTKSGRLFFVGAGGAKGLTGGFSMNGVAALTPSSDVGVTGASGGGPASVYERNITHNPGDLLYFGYTVTVAGTVNPGIVCIQLEVEDESAPGLGELTDNPVGPEWYASTFEITGTASRIIPLAIMANSGRLNAATYVSEGATDGSKSMSIINRTQASKAMTNGVVVNGLGNVSGVAGGADFAILPGADTFNDGDLLAANYVVTTAGTVQPGHVSLLLECFLGPAGLASGFLGG